MSFRTFSVEFMLVMTVQFSDSTFSKNQHCAGFWKQSLRILGNVNQYSLSQVPHS